MSRLAHARPGHYCLLIVVSACLFLPALGAPSLWDIDEGNNATAAREMRDAGDWVRPTFNYELRVDKPALLYWLQMLAYDVFGVGELAARLPSALAAILVVLLGYELGRRLFDAAAGLIAGLILASAVLFCGSAHFANPDMLLVACTMLTLSAFWRAFQDQQPAWLALAGAAMGLGVLAKGPVAIVLPWATVVLFAGWTRQARWLLQPRWLFLAGLLFMIVAVPWYALVGAATKGEFLRGFFLQHNISRFQAPMEGHSGPVYYHLVSLLVGLLPWSAFLVPALWSGVKAARAAAPAESAPYRFLLCWAAVYLVFFSISRTKLPNYILPLYPAVALLVGRYLDRWRQGELRTPGWVMPGSLAVWAGIGIVASLGMLAASGAIDVPRLRDWTMPGLQGGAALGLVLLLGGGAAALAYRRDARTAMLAGLAGSAALFTGLFHAWGAPVIDAYKAPRALVAAAGVGRLDQDIRVGCYDWFQPSLVFYSGRQVYRLADEKQAREFLQYPIPVYLFLPARTWDQLQANVDTPCRLLACHWDLYRGCEVVVVTNR